MNIGSEKEAREALAAICDWFYNDDSMIESMPSDNICGTKKHQLARQMAQDILDAANVDGLGGCDLCQQ